MAERRVELLTVDGSLNREEIVQRCNTIFTNRIILDTSISQFDKNDYISQLCPKRTLSTQKQAYTSCVWYDVFETIGRMKNSPLR
jgi:hypothetical protein